MAFKMEFYDSSECDKCTKAAANIHLTFTGRYQAERQILSFCWDCWEKMNRKVFKQWHQPEVDRDIPNSIRTQQ